MPTKKQKKDEKPEYHLWVVYDQDCTEPVGSEDYKEYQQIVTLRGVCRDDPKSIYQEQMKVSQKTCHANIVYLVIVHYTDGNTFGKTHGNVDFVGIFDDVEDARKVKDAVSLGKKICIDGIVHLDHRPWESYFAHLEDVEIHEFSNDSSYLPQSDVISHL